MDRPIKTY